MASFDRVGAATAPRHTRRRRALVTMAAAAAAGAAAAAALTTTTTMTATALLLAPQGSQAFIMRAARRSLPRHGSSVLRMSTTTGGGRSTSTSSSSTRGRPSSTTTGSSPLPPLPLPSLRELLTGGRQLLEESLQVAREVGPRAGLARTLSATRAVSETARDVLRELAEYQREVAANGGGGGGGVDGMGASPFTTQRLARTLRVFFERMGATYLKLGQFIASSPTLFPPELVLEMQKCLDKTEPVPYAVVSETLRQELGPNALTEVFEFVDPVPLASASIAQVHLGRLRGSGEEVAIKVLKPGVEDTLKADLGFLFLASRLVERLAPEARRASLGEIVGDIRTAIQDEVDFTKELKSLEEFRAFLAKAGITAATAPRPYPKLSTRRVLVMERLKGVSLIDLESIRRYTDDPEGALITALNTWSLSVVLCESFHADVHAGNVLVLEDGRVGFIDFGIVGRLSPSVWRAVQDLTEGLVGGDYRLMAKGLVAMGATAANVDEAKLAADLQALVGRLERLDPQLVVVADPLSQSAAASVTVDEEQVTRLLLDLVEVASSNGLKLPRQFGLLIKQALYFDRYTRLLAPTLDPLRDARVSFPRSADEAMRGRPSIGGDDDDDNDVVIDVQPKP